MDWCSIREDESTKAQACMVVLLIVCSLSTHQSLSQQQDPEPDSSYTLTCNIASKFQILKCMDSLVWGIWTGHLWQGERLRPLLLPHPGVQPESAPSSPSNSTSPGSLLHSASLPLCLPSMHPTTPSSKALYLQALPTARLMKILRCIWLATTTQVSPDISWTGNFGACQHDSVSQMPMNLPS